MEKDTDSSHRRNLYIVTFASFLFVMSGTVSVVSQSASFAMAQEAGTLPPPTGLTATTEGINVRLTWIAPTGEGAGRVTSYVPYRDDYVMASVSTLSVVSSLLSVPDTQYCFAVASADGTGATSDRSSESCVTFPVGTAVVPTDLTASAVSSNNIELTWQYVLSEEQWGRVPEPMGFEVRFIIERSTDAGHTWSIINSIYPSFEKGGSTEARATDVTIQPGTSNMYRVTAYDNQSIDPGGAIAGFSSPSNVATAAAPQAGSPPSAPSTLSFSNTFFGIADLQWKDNSNDETDFVIERMVGDSWSEMARYGRANASSEAYYQFRSLNAGTIYTLRVRAMNLTGLSEPSNQIVITIPSGLQWTTPVPSEHMLVVYNADDPQSVDVKNYYLSNRPLISSANVFALHFPPFPGPTRPDPMYIDNTTFNSSILNPIADWIQNHPEKPIRYVVLMWGVPSQELGYRGSTDYQISRSLQKRGLRSGMEYAAGRTTRFTPEYYLGTTALVSHIDVGTVAATKAYVDKLKIMYDKMPNKNIIIDSCGTGAGGTSYYVDGRSGYAPGTRSAILAEDPSADVQYRESGFFTQATNVLGYATGGTWSGLPRTFAIDGTVRFSGKSGWYIMKTGESFNGLRSPGNSGQSTFTEWFQSTSFGGTNYSNTPVGAVAHVYEPGGPGINSAELFSLWERGYMFIEAAWASRQTIQMTAIGDPFVANSCASPVVVDSTPPSIQRLSPANILTSITTTATMSVSTDENAVCKYGTTPNTSFSAATARQFSSTGTRTHVTTISNLAPGTSYTYYVRCQDTSLNSNQSDFAINFTVAQTPAIVVDNSPPTVAMTYPPQGSVIPVGNVTFSAVAADLSEVAGVVFMLDGRRIGQEDSSAPYRASIAVSVGEHTVYATARDSAGNSASSPAVRFIVRQDESVVPPPIIPNEPVIVPQPLEYYAPLYNRDNITTLDPDTVKDDSIYDGDFESAWQVYVPTRLERNLKLGDAGREVFLLQRSLNLLGYAIATSGPGSLGNENGYFDARTIDALKAYQESFESSGIIPTGNLDNATLAMLNSSISRLVGEVELSTVDDVTESPVSETLISRIISNISITVDKILSLIIGLFNR